MECVVVKRSHRPPPPPPSKLAKVIEVTIVDLRWASAPQPLSLYSKGADSFWSIKFTNTPKIAQKDSPHPFFLRIQRFQGVRSILIRLSKPKVKVLTSSPFYHASRSVLMFVWCVYSIWIQLFKNWNWLLGILHLLDLYDAVLNTKTSQRV